MSGYIFLFILFPFILFAIRWNFTRRFKWWHLILAQMLIGWALLIAAQWFGIQDLEKQISLYEKIADAPSELIEQWQAQDGGNVITVYAGWLVAFLYLVLCLPFYWVAILLESKYGLISKVSQ